MLYSALRPLLFSVDPERAHHLTMSALKWSNTLALTGLVSGGQVDDAYECMGLTFKNRVGLAAGLDKNGEYIDALAALGFGFIEVGTITPRPQTGNAKPRMFRLPEAQAIINRMGFNNAGVDALIKNVEKCRYKGVLGINIGKNFDVPVHKAVDDYVLCLEKVYAHASYVTVNISSPNTKGLRDLQSGDALKELLSTLKDKQSQLAVEHRKQVPLVLKVAPDLEPADIDFISQQLIDYQIEGLITTNTTLSRQGVEGLPYNQELGGLSGAPVFDKSTQCLSDFAERLTNKVALVGVGGILSAEQALQKTQAGAQLVQLYSGLVYQGPQLIRSCAKHLASSR